MLPEVSEEFELVSFYYYRRLVRGQLQQKSDGWAAVPPDPPSVSTDLLWKQTLEVFWTQLLTFNLVPRAIKESVQIYDRETADVFSIQYRRPNIP